MIKYAKDKGVLETLINTNGVALTPELSQKLIDAGLDYIIFSVDAFTKETYEKIRIGADFTKVMANINEFIKLRTGKKPIIRMQMVKMDINKHEIEDFIKFWSPMVDTVSMQDYTWRGEGESKLTSTDTYEGRQACPQLWQRMILTWDGKAIMCCRDWESENILGDLQNNTIREIWHNKNIKDIRHLHIWMRLDEIPICKKCTLKETYNWVIK
jgi:radical SAM protein with 4Fe4S-binding SPASM domain